MVTIKFIQPDGVEKAIEVHEGTNLMIAALDNGVQGILGDCGGACSCATCHCYIDEEFLPLVPPASDIEMSMIEFASDPHDNSRLGCQVVVTEAMSGMVVRLPESQY